MEFFLIFFVILIFILIILDLWYFFKNSDIWYCVYILNKIYFWWKKNIMIVWVYGVLVYCVVKDYVVICIWYKIFNDIFENFFLIV